MAELFIGDRMTTSTSSSKIDISSATVTLVSNSFVYDGSVKTQAVQSVVLNGQTLIEGTDYIVTNYFKINAGTYTLAVRGIGNYDGVSTANWSIAKAQGSISLNNNNISLNTNVVSDTIIVTRAGNGTISATSSDTNVATVSVSGNIVTVTSVATGDATITINIAAGDNYLPTSATASVSVTMISNVLAENSPATIQRAAQLGIGSQYWQVGDYTALISIDSFTGCTTATETRAFILGFDHNASLEGSGIHFQFGASNNGSYYIFPPASTTSTSSLNTFIMKSTDTNVGGWKSCNMRTNICPAFKSAITLDWQNVIKTCTKYTNNSTTANATDSTAITSTSDDIFMLAAYEVFGSTTYINSYESTKQERYAFFINGNKTTRYSLLPSYSFMVWGLRSPTTTAGKFTQVTTAGSLGSISARYQRGFAPAFVIG